VQPVIGYLLKKFPRLSETFILNEILQQEALGADVVILSRKTPDDEPKHPALDGLHAPIEVLPSTTGLDPWSILFAEGPEGTELLERLGPIVRDLGPYGHPRFGKLVAEALYLCGLVRELGINHIHTHFATDSAVVAHLLHRLGGPTYSITAHAKDIYRSTINPEFLSRMVAGSEFTTTVCQANLEHLQTFLDADAQPKLRKLFNGINLTEFLPPEEPRQEDVILSVGRLVEKKGFDVLIRAMVGIARQRPQVQCVIVGDGEERENLEALIGELDIGSHVQLTGALHQGHVQAHMQSATVFALPCRIGEDGNRDALPTVLLEALATGLPCVSTPVTGIPEILDHGKAGRIVPIDDVEQLQADLLELLGDADQRSMIARAGIAHAAKHFDGRVVARVLNEWHRVVIDSRSVA
jgi:glycosyltransferase involved in cell wall biosynthesis